VDPAEPALKVGEAHEEAAELADEVGLRSEDLVDSVKTGVDGGEISQRAGKPLAEEATAHAGLGVIEDLRLAQPGSQPL
jgi:hypothetical protein